MTRKIMRLQQIAEATGISINTLRWYRSRGHGGPRTFLLAGRVVAFEEDVTDYIDQARESDPLGPSAA